MREGKGSGAGTVPAAPQATAAPASTPVTALSAPGAGAQNTGGKTRQVLKPRLQRTQPRRQRRWRRRRRRPKSFYSWDDAGGRRSGDEALSQSRSGVGPERGGAGSFLAAGAGTGAGLFALLAHSPHQLGLRRCICIRSLPELSTLETTATPWAASRMSLSR